MTLGNFLRVHPAAGDPQHALTPATTRQPALLLSTLVVLGGQSQTRPLQTLMQSLPYVMAAWGLAKLLCTTRVSIRKHDRMDRPHCDRCNSLCATFG